jgi:hypothetical protein
VCFWESVLEVVDHDGIHSERHNHTVSDWVCCFGMDMYVGYSQVYRLAQMNNKVYIHGHIEASKRV